MNSVLRIYDFCKSVTFNSASLSLGVSVPMLPRDFHGNDVSCPQIPECKLPELENPELLGLIQAVEEVEKIEIGEMISSTVELDCGASARRSTLRP
jgi:hypothetical protein